MEAEWVHDKGAQLRQQAAHLEISRNQGSPTHCTSPAAAAAAMIAVKIMCLKNT